MNRLEEWEEFNRKMQKHIKEYTLIQYGSDIGNEQVDSFSTEDCWTSMMRYYNRRHSSVRGKKEQLRDMIKVAHYAQFIFTKLQKELKEDIY
jgi:hypothetical protein